MISQNHLLESLNSVDAQNLQYEHEHHPVPLHEPLHNGDEFSLEDEEAVSPLYLGEGNSVMSDVSDRKSREKSRGEFRESSVARSLRHSIMDEHELPNMWSKHYIGLYSQYAAIGLLYGTSGALSSFCFYVYKGANNTCANASSITFFAWSFKIIFAVITDTYRPFGLRRKPWMLFGWVFSLLLLLVLTFSADQLDASTWLVILLLIQFFAMFSDVPADGYSVELGHMEPPHQRGVILATGQMVRFVFCILAGAIQAFLLNGPSTSDPDCDKSFQGCWDWGLTINQYYGLIFGLTFLLVIPVIWLKETDPTKIPQHSLGHFMREIWATLQNLTTLYLLIFTVGTRCLTNFTSSANIYMQYSVIKLSNFQAGIDTITTYSSLSGAIWLFKTFLLNKDWRHTQYGSTIIASILGFLWLLVYYNVAGLRNGWFTIFIDLDQSFVSGITQVLFSLAVIELSKPGLEATTYELIITVANAAGTVNGIIATQLLTPLNSVACSDANDNCPSNTVDVNDGEHFEATDGPNRFTIYCVTLISISVACCLMFTQFLPRSKEQCYEWKMLGEKAGASTTRGYIASALCIVTVLVRVC